MAKLAVNGGTPVRTAPFPSWPVIDELESRSLLEVLESKGWYRGKKVEEFENAYADYCGTRHALGLAGGGTNALFVSLKALGLQPGDEVIFPSYTFIGTASPIFLAGGVPIPVDVDPVTYNLSVESAEAAITDRTRVIMPVHMAGCPADMDPILELAEKHGLKVIEDACQAHGAEYKGRHAGSMGHAAGFSFQASKNLNCGDGGALTTNSEEVIDRAFGIHNAGRERPGSNSGPPSVMGWNFRMSEFQAQLLLNQMSRLPEQNRIRDRNGRYLTAKMEELGFPPASTTPDATQHGYHLWMCKFNPEAVGGASRSRFFQAMSAEGISCSGCYSQPLHKGEYFKNVAEKCPQSFVNHPVVDYQAIETPNVEKACREAVCLRQQVLLGKPEDMDDVLEAVKKIQDNVDELKE